MVYGMMLTTGTTYGSGGVWNFGRLRLKGRGYGGNGQSSFEVKHLV
jgi:hypothetical protein